MSPPRSAEGDSPGLHAADTFRAGRGLCRASAVTALVEEAPARIAELVELGVEFDEGLGREGGHTVRRVVHAGGAETGKAISAVLAERVRAHPRITLLDDVRVIELWVSEGRCVGVLTDRGPVSAPATVLATGGYAALWARTTNPPGAVGEGLTLAYRAGAALADLEFVQFHPTALLDDGFLLSEALRGEGALLLDDDGNRFTDELAPRDVVARAIAAARSRRARPARDRAIALPRPDGDARARRVRPGGGADPRLTGGALHGRRDRDRPRRRHDAARVSSPPGSAPRPASTARTGSRRTRCSSVSSSVGEPESRRSPSL